MAQSPVLFQPASDQSLLVVLGQEITAETHGRVVGLLRLLEQEPIAGIRNLHPAYCSLLVVFDALRFRHSEIESILRGYLARFDAMPPPVPRLVEIPVCYDAEFGLDINEVAALCSLSVEEVIQLHQSVEYRVYFLGFVPGFAYLGDLPAQLTVPRLAVPRRAVPRGGVAIADRQTGIYPFVTPGGWRILGRTPIKMFRPEQKGLSLLSTGDKVRFVSISRTHFDSLEQA
jgi:inhibitor of KinA